MVHAYIDLNYYAFIWIKRDVLQTLSLQTLILANIPLGRKRSCKPLQPLMEGRDLANPLNPL